MINFRWRFPMAKGKIRDLFLTNDFSGRKKLLTRSFIIQWGRNTSFPWKFIHFQHFDFNLFITSHQGQWIFFQHWNAWIASNNWIWRLWSVFSEIKRERDAYGTDFKGARGMTTCVNVTLSCNLIEKRCHTLDTFCFAA